MIQNKNILVAGGTGLVGCNLVQRLHAEGVKVRATYYSRAPKVLSELYQKRDFTRMEDCLEATQGMDVVFLCAAQTFGAKVVNENPIVMVGPNLRIYSGLLEAARIHKVPKLVLISSSTVYHEAFHPIREDELDLNKPVYELYRGVGWMMRYIEQLAQFYQARYGMKIGIVRAANIYGPHDQFGEGAHVLPALIARAVAQQTPFIVWGDGHAVRDFIYVDDFVDSLLKVSDRYCVADPINVGGGVPISVRGAVDVILKAAGHDVTPVYDESKPTAIPYRFMDTTKHNSLLGVPKYHSFEEGVRKTVAWYKANYVEQPTTARV